MEGTEKNGEWDGVILMFCDTVECNRYSRRAPTYAMTQLKMINDDF